jgi:hypothetical protein
MRLLARLEPSILPVTQIHMNWISIPVIPQGFHHLLLFVQSTEERQALLTLSFVKVPYEFEDVGFAKFLARF